MFTGIVADIGTVRRIEKRGDTHVAIATHFDAGKIAIGASIACAGVCLTVVEKGSSADCWFAVTASEETLSRTNLGGWQTGRHVNLERPLRVGDELGGHIITGHIDGTAEVLSVVSEGESVCMTFELPEDFARFVAPKGSIALDGVSLTVNDVDGRRFGVNLIPHTLKVTTLGEARLGDRLNFEIDVLARYVARLAGA
ncbi:MAG TPA: riboflavin synthase [Rhizomicrobium sp.]|jgi:riboflavin synthase|nr:riboflavin synthase [Rhizomicrobium sp.]